MENELLVSVGLTKIQAKAYRFLLVEGPHSPPYVAKKIGESRTNVYNSLEKLLDLKLVKKSDKNKKFVFQAEPPTALQAIVDQKRDSILQQERQLHALMPNMLDDYFAANEKPGVRYFQGKDELKNIYYDQISANEPIYIVRSDYKYDVYDFDFMVEIRDEHRKAGIRRYVISLDLPKAPKNYQESDPYMLLDRTWLPAEEYTAPVEWNAYGNKLAIISFGKEAIGTIIESPQIAEAFRQMYKIMEKGIRSRPYYDKLPKKADYIATTAKDSKR